MKYMYCLFLLLALSCSNESTHCDQLKEGVFSLYENDKLIGQLYRKNNIQIEKYPDKQSYVVGKFKHIADCKLHMTHYYVEEPIDTITWLVSYSSLGKNTFKIRARPAYIDTLNYTYVAKIVKTNEKLPFELNELIRKLDYSE